MCELLLCLLTGLRKGLRTREHQKWRGSVILTSKLKERAFWQGGRRSKHFTKDCYSLLWWWPAALTQKKAVVFEETFSPSHLTATVRETVHVEWGSQVLQGPAAVWGSGE